VPAGSSEGIATVPEAVLGESYATSNRDAANAARAIRAYLVRGWWPEASCSGSSRGDIRRQDTKLTAMVGQPREPGPGAARSGAAPVNAQMKPHPAMASMVESTPKSDLAREYAAIPEATVDGYSTTCIRWSPMRVPVPSGLACEIAGHRYGPT